MWIYRNTPFIWSKSDLDRDLDHYLVHDLDHYLDRDPDEATRVLTLRLSLFSLTPLFIQNSVFCYHGKKSYQQ